MQIGESAPVLAEVGGCSKPFRFHGSHVVGLCCHLLPCKTPKVYLLVDALPNPDVCLPSASCHSHNCQLASTNELCTSTFIHATALWLHGSKEHATGNSGYQLLITNMWASKLIGATYRPLLLCLVTPRNFDDFHAGDTTVFCCLVLLPPPLTASEPLGVSTEPTVDSSGCPAERLLPASAKCW